MKRKAPRISLAAAPDAPRSKWTASLSASFEEAREAQERFQREGGDVGDAVGPLFQWNSLQQIEASRIRFEDTQDGYYVLEAIRSCANHDLVMPKWLADAYIARFDKVLNCVARTWDEAFDPPFAKGAQLAALRRRRVNRFAVYNKIREAQSAGKSINDELFEVVAKKLGLNRALVIVLWKEASAIMSADPPSPPHKRAPAKKIS